LRIVGIWVSGLLTPDVPNEPTAFIFMRQGTARRESITLLLSAMTQNTKIVNIFNVHRRCTNTEARSRNHRRRGKKAKRKIHPRTDHEGPEEE